MDASEIDVLVQRLVANPHDQEALAYAHNAGNADPKSYAVFLEKVGNATADPAYASHWLSEAANVWSITLGDVHRAARVLMMAVDKDPTQETAAERLAQLYRDKGEHKALVALLERRAKALGPLAGQNPDLELHLAGIHEELGRLWSEAPLSFRRRVSRTTSERSSSTPPPPTRSMPCASCTSRRSSGPTQSPLFGLEQAIITDPERKLALYRDEADVRKLAGDREGATVRLFARPVRWRRRTPLSFKSSEHRFSIESRPATRFRRPSGKKLRISSLRSPSRTTESTVFSTRWPLST